MQKKYGFVYIWYDRKHKRFYIGCHWGTEDDGYICSSNWMRDAYRRRPEDFKRKTIMKVQTNIKDLLTEEHKWLSLIKDEELGKKYYNLRKHHWSHWSTDENSRKTVGQKISASPNRNENISKGNTGKVRTEEAKQKYRELNKKQFENPEQREMRRQKTIEQWKNPEFRANFISKNKGKVAWNRKPIVFEGVEYVSIAAAKEVTGHCYQYIRKKIG